MTKRMVNVAVLVAVLTVAVVAPSTTFAATRTPSVSPASAHTGIGIIDMILNALGFNPVSGSRSTPTQAPVRTISTGTTTGTEGAIWGGKDRCPGCP